MDDYITKLKECGFDTTTENGVLIILAETYTEEKIQTIREIMQGYNKSYGVRCVYDKT